MMLLTIGDTKHTLIPVSESLSVSPCPSFRQLTNLTSRHIPLSNTYTRVQVTESKLGKIDA